MFLSIAATCLWKTPLILVWVGLSWAACVGVEWLSQTRFCFSFFFSFFFFFFAFLLIRSEVSNPGLRQRLQGPSLVSQAPSVFPSHHPLGHGLPSQGYLLVTGSLFLQTPHWPTLGTINLSKILLTQKKKKMYIYGKCFFSFLCSFFISWKLVMFIGYIFF